MPVAGSRILITGASRGIGAALARELAARGARLALVARDEGALRSLADELGTEARSATTYPADLTATDAIADLVAAVEADGPIDVLVNNAGVDLTGRFWELPADSIAHLITLNLTAPMLLCRAAIPGMLRHGRGHIVNVSSLAGTNTLPGVVPYGASKAGLSHFTAGLRAELKGTPVTTTLAQIGPVESEMMVSLRSYGPTRRAVARLETLKLAVDVPMATVVAALADAIEHRHRHVVLPKRDLAFPKLVEAPRRMTEWLLTGVDHQHD
jgi:short-subunit dehydrogenase